MSRQSTLWLAHYASKYYDPVKAHEYYEKTKQLKGRSRSTGKLSEEGKKIWEVTKSNITNEKNEKSEAQKTEKNNTVSQHRENAQITRENITKELKSLNDLLSNDLTARINSVKNSSLSKADKEAKIAQLRAENKDKKSMNSEEARAKRQEVSSQLKNVVAATAEAYQKAKTDLNQSYEAIFNEEYDKILSQHGKGSGKTTTSIPQSKTKAPIEKKVKKTYKTHRDAGLA